MADPDSRPKMKRNVALLALCQATFNSSTGVVLSISALVGLALAPNASLMSVLPRGDWFDIKVDRWDSVMAVNLKGIFLCCRAVYPYMRKRGGGAIVNISSSRIWEGNPNRLDYTTSKQRELEGLEGVKGRRHEENFFVHYNWGARFLRLFVGSYWWGLRHDRLLTYPR